MKIYTMRLCILALLFLGKNYAQEPIELTAKDSVIQSSAILGLGYNIVDDSGNILDEIFDVNTEWHAVAFPSRVSVGRYFKSGIGLEAIVTYNKYKVGKTVDGIINMQESDYYGFDTRVSYDLNKLIGQTAWFDPYVGAGLGYTDANNISRGTYNAIFGFRIWLSDRWGADLNTTGKWAMGDKGASNHIQHGAGVVYQFAIEKGLTKKGERKLAQLQAIEEEKQRVQDSIVSADRAREDALLAERLAVEREQAKLAAAEKAEADAENERKSMLENKIKKLGYVYFDLNSSYLNKDSKAVLDALTKVMTDSPEITLRVASHTDSRGTNKYNQWLSERRVKRTIDYLVEKGISAKRLEGEGLGESNLLNECDDTVYCPEEKHQVNRRSEFTLIKY